MTSNERPCGAFRSNSGSLRCNRSVMIRNASTVVRGSGDAGVAFPHAGVSFLCMEYPSSCASNPISVISPVRECCPARRDHRSLSYGLIWPKDGWASIVLDATAAHRLSSPDACGVIPREARNSLLRRPPLCSGPWVTPSRERDGDPDRRVRRRSPSAFRSPSRPRWARA